MGDRLFHQDVLAGAQSRQRRTGVAFRRGQDVHCVDGGVADQFLQGPVVAPAVAGGQRLGPVRLGVVRADEAGPVTGAHRSRVQLGHQAGAHEGDADAVGRSDVLCHASSAFGQPS